MRAIDTWLLKGYRGAKILWVAPTREKTMIAAEKLVRGEGGRDPLLPAELVLDCPKNHLASDQAIVLCDGTRIELRQAGANLKGLEAIEVLLDEGCEVKQEVYWAIAVNRTMTTGGQALTSTTPVAGHWMQATLYEGVPTYDDEAAATAAKVFTELTCFNNPWISRAEIERTIEVLGGVNDPRVQREIFGRWVPEGIRMWRHWKESFVRELPPEAFTDDITEKVLVAMLGRKASTRRHGLGWDINDYPQSMINIRIYCRKDATQSVHTNWYFQVWDELVQGASTQELAELIGERWEKALAIVHDANGAYAGMRGKPADASDASIMEAAGYLCRAPMYTPHGMPINPPRRDPVNLLHTLMIDGRLGVHPRCTKTIESFRSQVCEPDGLPLKKSNTKSDVLAGRTEAFGYFAYAAQADSRKVGRAKRKEWD